MADGPAEPVWSVADGKRLAASDWRAPRDGTPIRSIVQDMAASQSIDDKLGEFKRLGDVLPARVDDLVTTHGNCIFKIATRDLPYIRDADQRLHEMKRKLVGARTSNSLDIQDPAFFIIASLEERLRVLVDRVMKLKNMCKEYHMDVEECRAHARGLMASQEQLRKTARGALRRTSILASAAECLSARMNADPSGDWLSEPMNCSTISARGPAPVKAARARGEALTARAPGAAAAPPVDPPAAAPGRRIRSNRGGKTESASVSLESGSTSRSWHESGASGTTFLPSVPSVKEGGTQPDESACAAERKYRAEIATLELQVQRARQIRHRLSGQAASQVSRRSAMEEFFLLCMHDFRTALRGGQVEQPVLTQRLDHKKEAMSNSIFRAVAKSNEIQDLLFESIFTHRRPSYRRSSWTPMRGDEF